MQNTNWYKIFYWLTVADNFKNFFVTMIVLFMITVAAAIVTMCVCTNSDIKEDIAYMKAAKRWVWWATPICIIFWMLYLFTPSKSDTLLIIAGGSVGNFITSDSSSRAIPADITRFLHTRLQSEILDANDDVKRQLQVQTPKERLIDKAKQLTKDELIEYLKSDTTIITK